MDELAAIKMEIDSLKKELNKEIDLGNEMNNGKLYEISIKIDKLISKYYNLTKK